MSSRPGISFVIISSDNFEVESVVMAVQLGMANMPGFMCVLWSI